MPSLKCTYAEFIEIIKLNGFTFLRHGATSHQRWFRDCGERVYFVDISFHSGGDYIPAGTLQSMIRQSGLPKKLFRKYNPMMCAADSCGRNPHPRALTRRASAKARGCAAFVNFDRRLARAAE